MIRAFTWCVGIRKEFEVAIATVSANTAGLTPSTPAADACIAILKPIPLYATVYPNKVFDYMAAGKPVLLAIEGVIQDVVEAAGAGLIIPPGDPNALAEGITYMADHENEGIEMGIKGREYIKKHFDRPIQAEKFAQLMGDLSKSVKV